MSCVISCRTRVRQYPGTDRPRVVLDTTTGSWSPGPAPGIETQDLHARAGHPERVRLERWAPGASRPRLVGLFIVAEKFLALSSLMAGCRGSAV